MAHAHTSALHGEPLTHGGPRVRHLADLPGPKPLPLLGNALQVRTEHIHLDLERWARVYGDVFRFSLGPLKAIALTDQSVIGALLRDRPEGIRRPVLLSDVLHEMGFHSGVFNAEGEAWQKQRRMVMAAFLPTQVRGYHPTLIKVVERLKGRWQRAARQGQSLELLQELMRYTVDGVAGLAFGSDVNTLESEGDVIQDHLDKVFPAWFRRINAVVPYWRWVKLPQDHALDRSVKVINQAIDGFIAQARQRLAVDPSLRASPRNLLDAMIVAAEAPDSGLSHEDIAGNVITMLLAGEDTTATTLAWLFYFMHRHPSVMHKVRAEVQRGAAVHAPLSPEHLASLTYLDACINEALRLKPVAPFMPFETNREMVIGDVRVPADTLIFMLFRPDATDAGRVPQPEAFLPERWIEQEGVQGSVSHLKRVSIPFGAGPRVCPGRHLAITEIKMATAMLLTHFEIDHVDTADGLAPKERMSFTMVPEGLRMKLRERTGARADHDGS